MNDNKTIALYEYDYLNRSILSEDILSIIQNQKNNVLNILLRKMLLAISLNDTRTIITYTRYFLYLNKYHNIPPTIITTLLSSLDKAIKANITNIYFINNILSFMTKLLSIYKYLIQAKDVQFDFRTYYTIYEMFMKLSKTSSITLIADKNDNYFNTTYKFIIKAKKYFTISKEEYAFLKSEVNRYLLSQKTSEIGIGVEIAKIFLPVKLIAQDIEMQKSLFNLMKNRNEYSNSVMVIMSKIIKYNNAILIDEKEFVNVFFELLMNYFSSSSSTKHEDSKQTKKKQKYTISYAMCWILVFLCTKTHNSSIDDEIDNNLNIFINFVNMNLGEKQTKKVNLILNVLIGILLSVKKILFKKKKIFLNKLDVDIIYEENPVNDKICGKFISKFLVLITKCLFYYEDDAMMLMEALMDISTLTTALSDVNDVILTVYIDLLKQSENDVSVFFSKLSSYINTFFTSDNIEKSKYVNFIIEVISMCPSLFTSANEEQNINILFFLNNLYALIAVKNEEYSTNKHFLLIKKTVNDISVDIIIRMMQLFDFIANNSIHFFFLDFIHFATRSNTEQNIEQIKQIILTYANDNIISSDIISVFFLVVYYANFNFVEMSESLFELVIKNIVNPIEKDSTISISSKYLCNYDIKKSHFTLQEHKKSILIYYKDFVSCVDFKALYNKRNQIVEIVALCLNSDDRRYNKIGISILYQAVTSMINKKYELTNHKYILPNQEDIEYVLSLYDIFVKPYVEKVKIVIEETKDLKGEDLEMYLLEKYDSETEVIEILSISFKLFDIFTTQIDNPFLMDLIHYSDDIHVKQLIDTNTLLYTKIKEIRKLLVSTGIEVYQFLHDSNLIKNAKLRKYYMNFMLNDSIDANKQSLSKYNLYVKKAKLYYEHLNKEKLSLNEFLMHQYFACAMNRYFKINFDDETLKEINLTQYSISVDINTIEKKIDILSSLFISSIDESAKNMIFEYAFGIYNKLTSIQWESIYNHIYTKLFERTKRIVSKSISFNNKNKIYNILFFYSTILNFTLIKKSDMYTQIFSDFVKLTKLFKEDANISLALTVIDTKLIKKKFYLPLSFSLLQKRLMTLMSYSTFKLSSGVTIKQEIVNTYLRDISIEEQKQKLIQINKTIKTTLKNFLAQYLKCIDNNIDFFNETVNQLISIYIIDLLISICDPDDENDYALLSQYIKTFYSLYIAKAISTLNVKRILISLLSLLLQLQYESQFTFSLDKIQDGSDVNLYYRSYTKNKVFIANNKALFVINKSKKKEIENGLVSSYNDLERFITSLLNYKDLINDQQMIKINNEQASTTNINKHSEYKMIFQLFDLNYNREVLTYENIKKVFEGIKSEGKYDKNVISIIFCQIVSAFLKKNMMLNRYGQIEEERVNNIRLILSEVMSMYTNNQNKLIDNSIITLFIYVINACNINEFKTYFLNKENKKFIYFSYGNELSLQIFAILSTVYTSNRINCLFDNYSPIMPNECEGTLRHHYDVIEYYLKNQNKLLSNTESIIILIETLLLASKCFYYNPETYLFLYDDITMKFISYLVSIAEENKENKEIKKVIFVNVFLLQKYFINHPQFLIELLTKLTDFNSDYTTQSSSMYNDVGGNFSFCISNEKIKEYLIIINDKMKNCSLNINLKKFLLDFIINIIKANLYRVIQDKKEILSLMLHIINNCDVNELREYIMNNLLVFYINSSTDEKNKQIIDSLKNFLCDKDSIYDNILKSIFTKEKKWVALYILGAFVKGFYLYVPQHIQNIIIFFKYLHKNVYKYVGQGSKLIKQIVNEFVRKYEYSLYYVKESLDVQCRDAIRDLTNTNSYFS